MLFLNLQWASLPVAIYSLCTPDDGWDCHPKHVELAIAKNKKRNCCILLELFTTIDIVLKIVVYNINTVQKIVYVGSSTF